MSVYHIMDDSWNLLSSGRLFQKMEAITENAHEQAAVDVTYLQDVALRRLCSDEWSCS